MKQSNILKITTSYKTYHIPYADIVRIEANSNYSFLFFSNDKTLVVSKVLHWLQAQLDSLNFIRVHRSHLVNVDHVAHFCFTKKLQVFLKDKIIIEIARRKKKEIQRRFEDGLEA